MAFSFFLLEILAFYRGREYNMRGVRFLYGLRYAADKPPEMRMIMLHKKLLWILGFFLCLTNVTDTVCAKEADYQNTSITTQGFSHPERLTDQKDSTYSSAGENASITLTNTDGISAVYLKFDRIPTQWSLTDPQTGVSVTCGTNSFLHEYVDVKELFQAQPDTLTLSFPEGIVIADVYGFSDGEIPSWVQIWEPVCEEADLLLFSSHSDDEQLFFAGVLPYYAGERGLEVQVAYIVQHFEAYNTQNHQRPHEQLDGLWNVGVRHYPIISDIPDLYAESKDRDTAFAQATKVFSSVGVTYDDFISYITECIRRCKPLVIVSHDLNGEYGHGTHVMCASALTEAINYAADETLYSESAAKYGTWRAEKTYLHLYEENPIVMDFDIPLEHFGGKTAFQVTQQDGFSCHKSQHWTWFNKWIYGTSDAPVTKASDIQTYSPCLYGLYDTQVGSDTVGGDFFENVQTYEERAIAAAEAEKARLEAEAAAARAAAEAEKARLEEEARLAEEAARLEAELLLQQEEEAARAAAQALTIKVVIGAVVILLFAGSILLYRKMKKS